MSAPYSQIPPSGHGGFLLGTRLSSLWSDTESGICDECLEEREPFVSCVDCHAEICEECYYEGVPYFEVIP